MKILVTGVNGQLGYELVNLLSKNQNNDVKGTDVDELDITERQSMMEYFSHYTPDVIVHCAAFTAVDKAEDNRELCFRVNVEGTRNLVEIANQFQAKFLYISTDYVFDGEKSGPYEVSDVPNPKSVYGETKYLGEIETLKTEKHYIIRISWAFGKNGNNFVKTILRIARQSDTIRIVNDQFGSPTYTHDLSLLIEKIIAGDRFGIYHATNEGVCSWYDFAEEIIRLAHINVKVVPISTNEYLTKALRPKNSVLSKETLDLAGLSRLPEWKDALKRYLKEIEVIL